MLKISEDAFYLIDVVIKIKLLNIFFIIPVFFLTTSYQCVHIIYLFIIKFSRQYDLININSFWQSSLQRKGVLPLDYPQQNSITETDKNSHLKLFA